MRPVKGLPPASVPRMVGDFKLVTETVEADAGTVYRFWTPGELASDVNASCLLLSALNAGKNSPPPAGPALDVSWSAVPPFTGIAQIW